jgi:hypothetical protein
MDEQETVAMATTQQTGTIAELNSIAIVSACSIPFDTEYHGEVTAEFLFDRFSRFSAIVSMTMGEYYHIGDDIKRYAEKNKLATRDNIFEAIDTEFKLICAKRSIKGVNLDRAQFDMCLDASRDRKEANRLDCFKQWRACATLPQAKKVLATAKGERKKEPQKKTPLDRAAKIIREELYTQTSIETLALELFKGIKDVQIAKSLHATLENIIKRLEVTNK